jgi:ketosteroid isomerase-like protein
MVHDILGSGNSTNNREQFVVRKALLLASTLFAVAACSPTKAPDAAAAAPDAAADVGKLKAAEEQWFAMYNKGDAKGIANLYAEDGIVLAGGVPAAVGKAAILEFLKTDVASAQAAKTTDNAGEFNGSGVSGDLGWVSGAYHVSTPAGVTVDNGKYTTVFQRINGEWKIIRDTWNSDAAPAASQGPPGPPPKA